MIFMVLVRGVHMDHILRKDTLKRLLEKTKEASRKNIRVRIVEILREWKKKKYGENTIVEWLGFDSKMGSSGLLDPVFFII